MPRVSVAHEQAVRARIVDAALRVFAEKGYHGATIGDVVRDSGLSVGAIYTYFRGKDELFLATCEFSAGEGLGELGNRLVRGRTVAEKLAIAVGFFLDAMAGMPGEPDMAGMLVMQWARAEGEPTIRASLSRRRDQIAAARRDADARGDPTGELPPWTDAPALAAAYVTFLDGLLLWSLEQGSAYRREEAERRALALLRPILASAGVAEAPSVPSVPPRAWRITETATKPRLS